MERGRARSCRPADARRRGQFRAPPPHATPHNLGPGSLCQHGAARGAGVDPARRGGLGAGRRRLAAERRGRRLPRRAHGGRGAPGARVRERRGADRGREDAERERRPAHRGLDPAALPPRAGDPPRAPGAREEGLHLHERRRDPPGREPVQAAARALQRRDHRGAPARRRGPRREPRGRRRAAAPRLRRRGPGLPVHAARAPRGRVRGRGREARGRPGRAHLRRVRRGQDGDDEIRHALPRGPLRRHELGRRRRRDADDGHRVAGRRGSAASPSAGPRSSSARAPSRRSRSCSRGGSRRRRSPCSAPRGA